MGSFVQRLRAGAAALGVELDDLATDRLDRWRALVQEWSAATSLVADPSDAALLEVHLLDSLAHLPLLGDVASLMDVGAGAGLPGLPLAVARPAWRVVLVESAQRKADFLRQAVQTLELSNVTVVEARAEVVGRDPAWREQSEVATARRLAPLAVLLEYLLPLVRVGGQVLVAKGVGLDAELAAAEGVAELLGGGPPELLDGPRGRRFVRLPKLTLTPERYPRRVGVPAKRPLRGVERQS